MNKFNYRQLALLISAALPLLASPRSLADATTPLASLENPQPGSFQSGIGLLSGWSCAGPDISLVIDGKTTLALPYGSARTDTAAVCGAGHTNTGFGLLVNFNTLGPGYHTARLLVNGAQAGGTVFAVTVPDSEFIVGAAKDITVSDFPVAGEKTMLTWQQSQQNFAVKAVADTTTTTAPTTTTTTTTVATTTTTTELVGGLHFGTEGNDYWLITQAATFTLNGLGGVDTLALGTMLRCNFKIIQTSNGAVDIDLVSGASKPGTFHAILLNVERLVFDDGRDVLDLRTYDFNGVMCH